ncbi:hypothetical protein SAMN05660462_01129 [Proteiniborus ethanoligenes]|uniref:Flavoprotein n=2 Tax=Proteiniborus ethanoligenes TaxID=415015 RepID=A0A1H3NHE3_9FIRM|nr:hypothetical protein SAMN05660462_01129 [Proteiniborus ethanoligenes]
MGCLNMNKYNLTNDIVSGLVQKINNRPSNTIIADRTYEQHTHLNQHILAVFTGTNFGLNEALKELSKARRYGFSFDMAITENGEEIIGSQGIASIKSSLQAERIYTERDKLIFGEILESVDGIIVPMTTQDTATKLALGIQDCFISTLLWQGLWHGKKVLIDFENVLSYRGNKSKLPMLQQMMNDYVEKLQKMSVKSVNKNNYLVEMLNAFKDGSNVATANNQYSQNAVTELEHAPRQVITESDLVNMRANNKEVTVPMRAIITPLAYDKAKELGIRIIRGH